MGKLMRIKARLAARLEPTPDPKRTLSPIEDRASDLLPWRRRKAAQLDLTERQANHGIPDHAPAVNIPSQGLRKVQRRPGR
jgi:hypothetical protein